LQKIVENVGADRGLLNAEAGHQSGAHIAAKNINISLISLAGLREAAKAEMLSLGLVEVRRRAVVMKRYVHSLWDWVSIGPGRESRLKPGIDGMIAISIGGSASSIEDGVGDAQLGHFPVVMIIRDGGGERAVEAKDLEEFVVSASTILDGLDLMMPALTKGAE
jgi:hypothetical protein